jgi:hypothetical protein
VEDVARIYGATHFHASPQFGGNGMTGKPKRPRRQRKGDRLTYGGAPKDEVACDYAVWPFDKAARDMDQKWGVDRLPELVAPALAAKYGAALGHLNACLSAGKPEDAVAAAENCIKGMAAMDAAAEAAGHKPPGLLAECEHEGFHFGIIAEPGHDIAIDRLGLRLFTVVEIARILKMHVGADIIAEVKEKFPGSQIVNIKKQESVIDWEGGGDEIPF